MKGSQLPEFQKFEGCYHRTKKKTGWLKTDETNEYVCIEIGNLEMSFRKIDSDTLRTRKYNRISEDSFIRWDGALIDERIDRSYNSILDCVIVDKYSNVFKLDGNNLILHTYKDYMFKGLLGGYWFPKRTKVKKWERTTDDKCKR